MINFTKIKIEGFGSIINETEFKLNRHSLNVITGKVGSGKTSIPSSLVWCIYGETLKKGSSVETWEELRPENYRGTSVTVYFNINNKIEYCITRCINFKGKINKIKGNNNLFIIEDGENDNTKGKRDKQLKINKIIGYSHNLFINTIVFGQRMKRIIDETGTNKKKIFEEAFEVTFIEEAKKSCIDKNKDILELSHNYINEIDKKIDKIEALKNDYHNNIKYEKLFNKNKNEKIKNLEKDINRLSSYKVKEKVKNRLLKNKKLWGNYLINRNKYNELIEDVTKTENRETQLEKLLSHNIFKICQECGSKLNSLKSEKLKRSYKKELKQVSKKADDLRDEQFNFKKLKTLEKIENHIQNINEKINEIKALVKLNKGNKEKIEKKKIKLHKAKQKSLKIKSTNIKKKIKLQKTKLISLRNKNKKLEKDIALNKWLINDPLSNSGLKAYIFNSLLSKVNDCLFEYSNTIGFNIEFGIDLESHRKDFYQTITRNNILKMYEDLSGGQKQLVDTCIALAIHEVVSSIRPINILFLDEPFESLDEENIEIISDLVDNKAKHKCIYLITHHMSFNPITSNKIYFELSEQGHTKVL